MSAIEALRAKLTPGPKRDHNGDGQLRISRLTRCRIEDSRIGRRAAVCRPPQAAGYQLTAGAVAFSRWAAARAAEQGRRTSSGPEGARRHLPAPRQHSALQNGDPAPRSHALTDLGKASFAQPHEARVRFARGEGARAGSRPGVWAGTYSIERPPRRPSLRRMATGASSSQARRSG